MGKITRTLLISMIALCLCSALIVGGTYALFTETVEVNNHLVAGNLLVELERTTFDQYVLTDDGTMDWAEQDDDPLDLKVSANKLFDVTGAVPTSEYKALITITNRGSVAFKYTVKMLWEENGEAADFDDKFANQIEITVESAKLEGGKAVFMLDECAENVLDLGVLTTKTGENAETFTVTAKFITHADNDLVKNQELEFDLQVFAEQYTGE